MKPIPHRPLLAALVVATLACPGCMQPAERSAGPSVSFNEIERATPHRCRSSVSQSTQKGCRASGAVAHN